MLEVAGAVDQERGGQLLQEAVELVHQLAGLRQPVGKQFIFREGLEQGLVGGVDVFGVARQRDPAKRTLARFAFMSRPPGECIFIEVE